MHEGKLKLSYFVLKNKINSNRIIPVQSKSNSLKAQHWFALYILQ